MELNCEEFIKLIDFIESIDRFTIVTKRFDGQKAPNLESSQILLRIFWRFLKIPKLNALGTPARGHRPANGLLLRFNKRLLIIRKLNLKMDSQVVGL